MTEKDTDGLFPDLIQSLEESDLGLQPPHPQAGDAPPADGDAAVTAQEEIAPETDYVLLSELLRDMPVDERSLVVENFEDGVRRGVIRSVPLEGAPFTVRLLVDGQPGRRRTLQDEIIQPTPEFSEWLQIQRIESSYLYRAATGRVSSTLERLRSGQDQFRRLAELRRQLARRTTRTAE